MIGSLEAFVPGTNFLAYEDRLKQFFLINDVKPENKTPLFITIAGPDVYDILMSLTVPELPSAKPFDELLKLLRDHFTPKKNKRAERYKFNKAVQEEGELLNEFIVRLKSLSQTCRFGEFMDDVTDIKSIASIKLSILNDALTDRFIIGIRNERIQQLLLDDDKLTFEECCNKALNMEMAEKESKAIQPWSTNSISNQMSRPRNRSGTRYTSQHESKHRSTGFGRHKSSVSRQKCRFCGRELGGNHNEKSCPAKQWECFSCLKKGHTSVVCQAKRKVNTVNSVNSISDAASCEIIVDGQPISFEVDTGACATIISLGEYQNKFSNKCISKCSNKLLSVTGESINSLGKIKVDVCFDDCEYKLDIIVIDSERYFKALLGRSWLDALLPNWKNFFIGQCQINQVKSNEITTYIKRNFPKVVENKLCSTIEGFSANIVLKPNQTPIFHAPYSVPYKIREKFVDEINRLVEEQILVPVKSAKRTSPLVIVPNSDG